MGNTVLMQSSWAREHPPGPATQPHCSLAGTALISHGWSVSPERHNLVSENPVRHRQHTDRSTPSRPHPQEGVELLTPPPARLENSHSPFLLRISQAAVKNLMPLVFHVCSFHNLFEGSSGQAAGAALATCWVRSGSHPAFKACRAQLTQTMSGICPGH